MQFSCGKTEAERERALKRLENWHDWFAWRPVTICDKDGVKTCAWLETVRRKGDYNYWCYAYSWNWEYQAKYRT